MKRIMCAAAAVSALAVAAQDAAATDGWYLGLGMGANLMHSQDFDQTRGGNASADSEHDLGFAADLTLGYGFANGFRIEGDSGYGMNQFDEIGGTPAFGETEIFTWTANLLYDFRNGSDFTPYIGAGAGAAIMMLDDTTVPGGSRISENNFGWIGKGIAGLTYDYSNYIDLFAQYQYIRSLSDFEFDTSTIDEYDVDYEASSFLLGLRYVFNKPGRAPAPRMVNAPVQNWRPDAGPAMMPPEPAAPIAPSAPLTDIPQEPQKSISSRSYLVFFDFDSSKLTTTARDVIGRAIEDARNGELIRFELTGHADRSGTVNYNMGLSRRRADKVKNALVQAGVPEEAIAMYAKGESQPLVPTNDGVREPQNRRVEIVYTLNQ